jgi:hypothetical protein
MVLEMTSHGGRRALPVRGGLHTAGKRPQRMAGPVGKVRLFGTRWDYLRGSLSPISNSEHDFWLRNDEKCPLVRAGYANRSDSLDRTLSQRAGKGLRSVDAVTERWQWVAGFRVVYRCFEVRFFAIRPPLNTAYGASVELAVLAVCQSLVGFGAILAAEAVTTDRNGTTDVHAKTDLHGNAGDFTGFSPPGSEHRQKLPGVFRRTCATRLFGAPKRGLSHRMS